MFTIKDLTRTLAIADSLLADINLTQDSQLRRLVDGFDLSKIETIEDIVRLAQEDPMHEIMMSEMASKLGMGVAAVSRTIANEVLGLVDDVYEDLVAEMKVQQQQQTAYSIVQRKIPDYLESDYLESIASQYERNSHINVRNASGFPALTREELMFHIRANNPEGLANMLGELFSSYDFDIVDIYNRHFRMEAIQMPISSTHMAPSYLPYMFLETFFCYHMADSLLAGEPLDSAVMSLADWNDSLIAIRSNFGLRYRSMIVQAKVIKDRGQLIVRTEGGDGNKPLTITVDKEVYSIYAANEEVVGFGPMWVLGRVLVDQRLMRVPSGAVADYPQIANDWTKSRQRVNRASEIATAKRRILILLEKHLNSKEFETDYFTSYLTSTGRAITPEQRAGALLQVREEKLELLRKNCSDYVIDSPTFEYDCLVYVIANTFYPHIGAYEYIRLVNQMGDTAEGLNGREAALLALPETISKWLFKSVL